MARGRFVAVSLLGLVCVAAGQTCSGGAAPEAVTDRTYVKITTKDGVVPAPMPSIPLPPAAKGGGGEWIQCEAVTFGVARKAATVAKPTLPAKEAVKQEPVKHEQLQKAAGGSRTADALAEEKCTRHATPKACLIDNCYNPSECKCIPWRHSACVKDPCESAECSDGYECKASTCGGCSWYCKKRVAPAAFETLELLLPYHATALVALLKAYHGKEDVAVDAVWYNRNRDGKDEKYMNIIAERGRLAGVKVINEVMYVAYDPSTSVTFAATKGERKESYTHTPGPDCTAVRCQAVECKSKTVVPKGKCCPVCPVDCSKTICKDVKCQPQHGDPYVPSGECCKVCPPDCTGVRCLPVACEEGFEHYKPQGQCCLKCRLKQL